MKYFWGLFFWSFVVLTLWFGISAHAGNWMSVPDDGFTYDKAETCKEKNPDKKCYDLGSYEKETVSLVKKTVEDCKPDQITRKEKSDRKAQEISKESARLMGLEVEKGEPEVEQELCDEVEVEVIEPDPVKIEAIEEKKRQETEEREQKIDRRRKAIERLKESKDQDTQDLLEVLDLKP